MTQKQNTEEKIGFHKGALTTLLKEYKELRKMTSIVGQLAKTHSDALKKLGVEVNTRPDKPGTRR